MKCATAWFSELWREYAARRDQRTFVYCPACRFELCAGGAHLGLSSKGLETYRCAQCGEYSAWDFDAPTPLLVRADPEGR